MTEFIADESDDMELVAPVRTVRRMNLGGGSRPSRQAVGAFPVPSDEGIEFDPGPSLAVPQDRTEPVSDRFVPAAPTAGAVFVARRYFQTASPLVLTDVVALVVCGLLGLGTSAALAALGHAPAMAGRVALVHLLALFPLLCAYWYGGLYPGVGMHPVVELQQITKLNTSTFLVVMTTLLITGNTHEWGVFFTVTWLVSLFAVPLARALARRICAAGQWWGYPTVVISSGHDAADTVKALLDRPQSGLRPCGIIDPAGHTIGSVLGVPYLSGSGDQEPSRASYAVVPLPDMPREALAEVLEIYRNRFPHLLVLASVTGLPSLWLDPRDCGGGLAGIELRNKLLLPWPRLVKRTTDLALTVAALCFGLPLLAVLALAVKLTSHGSVLFGQTRLGRNGRPFTAWKFRTMRPDADALLQQLLCADPAASAEWERDHKLRNDPRITRTGQWLRKTSLDELPQLWNVLIGDMSLVGPRPIVDAEVPRYGEIFRLYAEVPPGITGLWQVSGRNNTTYRERIRLDEFYVRNWSPWLDLHILVRTVKTIIFREGAY